MIMKVNFKSTVLPFVAALFFLSCETPSNGNADEPTPPVVEEDEEEETYRIVTTVREDSLHGLISNISPMGKALMGHKVGDVVQVQVNDSYSYPVKILKIEKTSDESSDEISAY
jgi:hypothetical protein